MDNTYSAFSEMAGSATGMCMCITATCQRFYKKLFYFYIVLLYN